MLIKKHLQRYSSSSCWDSPSPFYTHINAVAEKLVCAASHRNRKVMFKAMSGQLVVCADRHH